MIELLLLVGAGAALWWWHKSYQSVTTAMVTQKPTVPSQTTPGVVPTLPGPAGSLTVIVQPGDMGTLKIASGPSGPSINVQTPSGVFQSMTSSNPNVVSPMTIDPNGRTAGVSLGGALFPGTAVLTTKWLDGSGALQTTTFTVSAS